MSRLTADLTPIPAGWDTEAFSYHGGYLTYYGYFIARWKYGAGLTGRGEFKRFLIKNFTPDGYLDAIEQKGATPMGVLEAAGFISKKDRARCQRYGMEETRQNVTYAGILELQSMFPERFTTEYIQEHYPGCPLA
tara:strand:+ start:430 stop:834 length:405 start_codon:yes stop_codon:yes gene_type:complete